MDGERESVSKMTVSSTARKGLRPDWKTAWAALQMKLVPLIEAKAVVGFFVGGEMTHGRTLPPPPPRVAAGTFHPAPAPAPLTPLPPVARRRLRACADELFPGKISYSDFMTTLKVSATQHRARHRLRVLGGACLTAEGPDRSPDCFCRRHW